MPGPKPKPTHLKALQGNPGGRRLNRREPASAPIGGTPPAWLSAAAKRVWRQVLKDAAPGLLQRTDRQLVIRYALAATYAREVAEGLEACGLVYTSTKTKHESPSGKLTVLRGLWSDMLRMEGEMGFTPSGRSKIELPQPTTDADPWADLKR